MDCLQLTTLNKYLSQQKTCHRTKGPREHPRTQRSQTAWVSAQSLEKSAWKVVLQGLRDDLCCPGWIHYGCLL